MANKRFSTVPRLRAMKKRELSIPDYDLDDYEEDVELYGETIYSDVSGKTFFEDSEDTLNQDGVGLMDIFLAKYRNINVFFMVSKTKSHSVALFELETSFGEFIGEDKMLYESLVKGLKPRKRPYIVPNNNCWSKTEFWVKTDKEGRVHIPTLPQSPLCKLDVARGRKPIFGVVKCQKLPVDKLIKEYGNLTKVPFPVEGKADWISEKEQKENYAIA